MLECPQVGAGGTHCHHCDQDTACCWCEVKEVTDFAAVIPESTTAEARADCALGSAGKAWRDEIVIQLRAYARQVGEQVREEDVTHLETRRDAYSNATEPGMAIRGALSREAAALRALSVETP